jgi:hypothetical protein
MAWKREVGKADDSGRRVLALHAGPTLPTFRRMSINCAAVVHLEVPMIVLGGNA